MLIMLMLIILILLILMLNYPTVRPSTFSYKPLLDIESQVVNTYGFNNFDWFLNP